MSQSMFPKFKSSPALQAAMFYARKRHRNLRIAAAAQVITAHGSWSSSELADIFAAVGVATQFTPLSAFSLTDGTSQLLASLSNSNMTVTGTNGVNGGIRGTQSHSSGKVMIQFSLLCTGSVDGLDYVGVGTAADTLGLASGSQDQAIMISSMAVFSDGFITNNGGTGGWPTAWVTNPETVLDLAIDFTAGTFWFRYDGGCSITINTGPGSLPSGFSTWG